jgi:hypothetical protein
MPRKIFILNCKRILGKDYIFYNLFFLFILISKINIMTFTNIVSEIQNLSFEDKENLKKLLEKYLIEEKRENIYNDYKESVQELKEGRLKFSDDIKELKNA